MQQPLDSLSQNLTVFPAPSERESLACRKLCNLSGSFPAMSRPHLRGGWHRAKRDDWGSFSRREPSPSPAVTPLPKGEALAKPQALWSAQKLYRTAKASLMREVASPTGLDGRSPYPDYSFSRTTRDSSPKWEQAHPQALRSARKLCRHAKGSPFGRAGKPDRA